MEEEKKKLFGRGIYGSKDVPIRILDGLIVGMILLAVVLTVIFSINGGYRVTFDTRRRNPLSEAALWKISGKA